VTGGNRLDKGDYQHGWFLEPTVFIDVDPKMRIAQEEIFGPVVSIIPVRRHGDAIEIANNIEYGLSSSIYTKDVNKAFAAVRDLEAGITYINAPTIGAEVHLPFGGTKATGNGHREGGIGAIDFYTEWKSVYVDYSDKLQKAGGRSSWRSRWAAQASRRITSANFPRLGKYTNGIFFRWRLGQQTTQKRARFLQLDSALSRRLFSLYRANSEGRSYTQKSELSRRT
jgi:delta 1-pyrroline-5-carboxylate dehydrogenase